MAGLCWRGGSLLLKTLLTSLLVAIMSCHKQGEKETRCPSAPTLLFVLYRHASGALSHLMFSICFWPIQSGTAQQQKPVDSGLLTTTGWHTKLYGDLTVVEDRQNCFQCTPKEALSKANIDFGEGLFFFFLPVCCQQAVNRFPIFFPVDTNPHWSSSATFKPIEVAEHC